MTRRSQLKLNPDIYTNCIDCGRPILHRTAAKRNGRCAHCPYPRSAFLVPLIWFTLAILTAFGIFLFAWNTAHGVPAGVVDFIVFIPQVLICGFFLTVAIATYRKWRNRE